MTDARRKNVMKLTGPNILEMLDFPAYFDEETV